MIHFPKKDILLFLCIFVVIGAFFIVRSINNQNTSLDFIEQQGVTPMVVGTSAPFLKDMIARIGGFRVSVIAVSGPDDELLQKTQQPFPIFFALGAGNDDWVKDMQSKFPDMRVLWLNKIAGASNTFDDALVVTTQSKTENEESKKIVPRYFWLSFSIGQKMIQETVRQLGLVDAVGKELYLNNAYEYAIEVATMQKDLLKDLASYTGEKVALQSTSYNDLAADLQLSVAALFDVPSTQDAEIFSQDIVGVLKKKRIFSVIAGEEFPQSVADVITRQTATNVAILSPFGTLGYTKYIDILRYNASQILKVFR